MADTKSIEINIYLLERTETAIFGEWAKCIVAAASEQQARQIANEAASAEGYVWTDGALTQIRRIGVAEDGIQGVILAAPEE